MIGLTSRLDIPMFGSSWARGFVSFRVSYKRRPLEAAPGRLQSMPHFICATCGTQFAESETPPERCPICEDERQYVKATGQQWTTPDRLRKTHKNTLRHEEPGLVALGVEPHFAIGQRAFFL